MQILVIALHKRHTFLLQAFCTKKLYAIWKLNVNSSQLLVGSPAQRYLWRETFQSRCSPMDVCLAAFHQGRCYVLLIGWYWVRIPVRLALHLHINSSSRGCSTLISSLKWIFVFIRLLWTRQKWGNTAGLVVHFNRYMAEKGRPWCHGLSRAFWIGLRSLPRVPCTDRKLEHSLNSLIQYVR